MPFSFKHPLGLNGRCDRGSRFTVAFHSIQPEAKIDTELDLRLCASLDKIFKTFSTQEVQLDPKDFEGSWKAQLECRCLNTISFVTVFLKWPPKEMKNFREKGTLQYIEQKFQATRQFAAAIRAALVL